MTFSSFPSGEGGRVKRYVFTLPNSTRVVVTWVSEVLDTGIPGVSLSYLTGHPIALNTLNRYKDLIDEMLGLVEDLGKGHMLLVDGFLVSMDGFRLAPHYLKNYPWRGR